MRATFLSGVACGLTLLQVFVSANPIPRNELPDYFQTEPITRCDITADKVMADLGAQLSLNTTIDGPSSSGWANLTERWSTLEMPDIEVVVSVGAEADIAKVVQYCNKNGIEFMAVNRGHALCVHTMKKFKGVQIDVRQLTGITIQPDETSAVLQAGTYGIEVMQTLWDQGFVTPTGAMECVGFMGPALGGGHGRLEGQYGLISDSMIKLNVVLADGSTVTVSNSSHADLFWALQGAGHNFGIVTSVESKIYPRVVDTWHYHNYYWSQDKLETVFETLNVFHANGNTPVKMGVNFGAFRMDPTYGNDSAIIWWSFAYDGSAADAEALLAPFNQIGSLHEETGDVPYPEIPGIQGTSYASGGCKPARRAFSHALLGNYTVSAQREIYEQYTAKIAELPSLAPTAVVFYEGYATRAAADVDASLTAYPHRDELHIVYFMVSVPADDDSQQHQTHPHQPGGAGLFAKAQKWADDVQAIWNRGRKPAYYVNYNTGVESLEATYGHEPWRLKKLRGLKAKYDPHNRFRYFMPINPQ